MKILLIRLRSIGDVVFTTPAIAALRQQYPSASITYLVEAAAEPVVRHNPHLTEIIVAQRPRGLRRLLYDFQLARRLRRAGFDLVIDFHGGPRSAWLTRATGAAQRIGYDLPGRSWLYTNRLPWSRALVPPRHSVDNQSDLLTPLADVRRPDREWAPVEMSVDAAAARSVDERLTRAGASADTSIVVIHVSAGNPFRRWPADHFARVAASLAGDAARRIIITSGPSESEAADAIASKAQDFAGPAGSRVVRCGEFDLSELRALVGRAALFIGGDSGPLHIAATTNVPVVALFGPTLPERSMPWRGSQARAVAIDAGELPCRPCHQRQCAPGDFRCLTSIGPERVVAAAEQLLSIPS